MKASEVLNKAADLFESGEIVWLKGEYSDCGLEKAEPQSTSCCSVGILSKLTNLTYLEIEKNKYNLIYYLDQVTYPDQFYKLTRFQLAAWNDCTTKEDVILKFKEAAKLAADNNE